MRALQRGTAAARGPTASQSVATKESARRPDHADSNASTLVPDLTPTSTSSAIGTSGPSTGQWQASYPVGDNSSHCRDRYTPVGLAAGAMRSDSGVTSSRVVPAPLDLSAITGPTPPKRVKTISFNSAPRSSKPVVLQVAALEQLERMRRAKRGGVTAGGGRRPGLGVVGSGGEAGGKVGLKETLPAATEPDAPRGSGSAGWARGKGFHTSSGISSSGIGDRGGTDEFKGVPSEYRSGGQGRRALQV